MVQNSKMMLKIDSATTPKCGCTRYVVCQITDRNGKEFKIYVKIDSAGALASGRQRA